MDNALNEKLDLSALHLGIISVGALLGAVVTLVVCILAVRIITVLLRRVLGKTTLEQRVSKYIVSTVRFVLWVVTVLIVAQQLGIHVTSLVALFSVVSLAVSLAVQNVLANVAGGLVLLVTKPFTVGDYIDTPSGEGTVREMSLTYTFLETMEGQRLAVPNSTLSSGKIINYSTLATRRLQHKVTASYDDAAADVRRACLTAVGRTANVLADPAPVVYVSSYGESSIEYIVRCWRGRWRRVGAGAGNPGLECEEGAGAPGGAAAGQGGGAGRGGHPPGHRYRHGGGGAGGVAPGL